jgi:hypothetical protein
MSDIKEITNIKQKSLCQTFSQYISLQHKWVPCVMRACTTYPLLTVSEAATIFAHISPRVHCVGEGTKEGQAINQTQPIQVLGRSIFHSR